MATYFHPLMIDYLHGFFVHSTIYASVTSQWAIKYNSEKINCTEIKKGIENKFLGKKWRPFFGNKKFFSQTSCKFFYDF